MFKVDLKFPAVIQIANLNGMNGFTISGFSQGTHGGTNFGASYDVNGDGIADLVIGADGSAPDGLVYAGSSYVIFGQSGIGATGNFNVANFNGANGFTITGFSFDYFGGHAVSIVGDLNADGIADLVVGAPGAGSFAGICYVIFGKSDLGSSGVLNVGSLTGSAGFHITGFPVDSSEGSFTLSGVHHKIDGGGASVSGGDINADGIVDLILGAPYAFDESGACYVIFGGTDIATAGSNVASLTGSNGFVIVGFPSYSFGCSSVRGADINGDGIADILIGAPGYPTMSGSPVPFNFNNPSTCYVIFGRSGIGSSGIFHVSSLNGLNGFGINGFPFGSHAGWSLDGVGDINQDGIGDFVIGAPFAYSRVGVSYVIFGQASATSASFNISKITGANGFVLTGFPDEGGYTVSRAGDINGDGIKDLIVGSYEYPSGVNGYGSSYIIFGKAGIGNSGSMDVSTLTGENGFVVTGFPIFSDGGLYVSYAGDINNDGVDDVVIGAPGPDVNYDACFVIFGEITTPLLITQNNLIINERQTLVLSSHFLNATNPQNPSQDSKIQFNLSLIKHGHFYKTTNTSASLTSLLQQDIRNGQILFAHDGSGFSPSFYVSVSYADMFALGSASQAANVTFLQSFNLVNNALTINQGQTVVLTAINLSAVDHDNPARNPSLIFSINNVQHGHFFSCANCGELIPSLYYAYIEQFEIVFTQADIQDGYIHFEHDGSIYAPSYDVTVINGRTQGVSQSATISFDAIPVIDTNSLTINQGQMVLFNSSNLSAHNPYIASPLTFIMESVQNGFFAFVSAPSIIITQFTQAQLQSGNVQFTHDGSFKAPSYNVSASDGRLISAPQSSKISFDIPPTLVANTLTINQGQTMALSSSNLDASDPYASSFAFIISNVKHGYFSFVNSPTVSITSFTSAQIESGSVQFVHDGTENSPGYDVVVSDGRLSSTPQAATISFDVTPTLLVNALTINQGQTVVLTLSNLNAASPYTTYLTFMITNEKYGYFAFVSAPTIAITNFTSAQVQSGDVQFVHDGSSNPPSYEVTVTDGRLSSASQSATISFDVPPTLVANTLMVNQGQTVVLSSSNLSSSDLYTSIFTFTASNIQHGYFALLSAPTTPISQFTQAQVQSGAVQFVHDGSANPPSYNITVSDGRLASPSQAATILFDVPPNLVTNTLTINRGQTVVLNTNSLSASDSYTSTFTFTISNVQHGYFALLSAPSTPITQFSQAQIQNGAVQFVHDGSANPPSYSVSVSDGRLTSATQVAVISFDIPPALLTNTLTINQGQTVILTTNNLSASDPFATGFTFLLSNIQHGYFALTSAPSISITQFTQTQIQNGLVLFVHDGTLNPPDYSVKVSDGRIASASQAATISFDIAPTLAKNSLIIGQGQTIVISLSNLSALDPYSSSFIFTVSNLSHGYFALTSAPTTAITQFTQAQIQNGNVQFVHDGSLNPPHYSVSVSDGRLSSTIQPANITFDVVPTLLINTLTITQGQSVILNAKCLNASDPYSSSFTFTASQVQHGHFAFVRAPESPITSFTQAQINSGLVEFVSDGGLLPPSYVIVVSDGYFSTAPSTAYVSFTPTSALSSSNTTQNSIIGGTISGGLGVIFLFIKFYLSRKTVKNLQKSLDEAEANLGAVTDCQQALRPIVNKVFEQINTAGFLGYRSEKSAKAYVAAIEKIIIHLNKLGVDINLKAMKAIGRSTLINEIAKQIQKHLVPKRSICSTATICSFFKSEVTPSQINDKAEVIANAVKDVIGTDKSPVAAAPPANQSDIELIKIITPESPGLMLMG